MLESEVSISRQVFATRVRGPVGFRVQGSGFKVQG